MKFDWVDRLEDELNRAKSAIAIAGVIGKIRDKLRFVRGEIAGMKAPKRSDFMDDDDFDDAQDDYRQDLDDWAAVKDDLNEMVMRGLDLQKAAARAEKR